MWEQPLLPAPVFTGLPPVAVNDDALLRFDQVMDRRLAELEVRFYEPRQHEVIEVQVLRHRNQPPRQPR